MDVEEKDQPGSLYDRDTYTWLYGRPSCSADATLPSSTLSDTFPSVRVRCGSTSRARVAFGEFGATNRNGGQGNSLDYTWLCGT